MSQSNDSVISAAALSRFGQSLDACIQAERADLVAMLGRSDEQMQKVDQQLASLTAALSNTAVSLQEPLEAMHRDLLAQQPDFAEKISQTGQHLQRLEVQLAALGAALSDTAVSLREPLEAMHRELLAQHDLLAKKLLHASHAVVQAVQSRFGAQDDALLIDNRRLNEECGRLAAAVEFARKDAAELVELRGSLTRVTVEKGRIEEQLAAAQSETARTEELARRLQEFKRNARARDAMFRDEANQIRLVERLAAAQETARANLAEQKFAALAMRKGYWEAGPADGMSAADPLLDDVVTWLAVHAPGVMLSKASADARFEADCARTCGDLTFLAAAYSWILGRLPDDEGRAFYLRNMQARLTRHEVLASLAASQEAGARVASLAKNMPEDRDAFVEAAYRLVLGRRADGAGATHYLAKLDAGLSRENVILDLARSPEAAAKPLLLASALRVVNALRRQSAISRLRRKALRLFRGVPPEQGAAWLAGRTSLVAADADRAWLTLQHRVDQLQNELQSMIAMRQVTPCPDPAALDHSGNARFGVPRQGQLELLKDVSSCRTPQDIRSAIRSELATGGQ